ncbi:DUF5819 family protein [Luethyella okanaganae]|uniref:DUF5819 family protein n=1 Tax=Luethyella okanaganae TaxID=69372 RepID=A0ABW1VE73_9MICO
MSNSPAERPPKTLIVRTTAAVAVLFTAWHLFASFLWISPPSTLRELVPGSLLSNYMLPWFGQSWSVFAPAPINGDYRLRVRANLADGEGRSRTTEWVDATAVELSMSHYNLFPPRAAGLATHQASLLKDSYDALNEDQRKIVALDYYAGDNWLGRMREAMTVAGSQAVDEYVVQERHSAAYATQVALAVWGDGVTNAQFEVSRQNVVPFEKRNDPNAKRPPRQLVDTGWRGLIKLPGQSNEAFAATFRETYKHLEQK